MDCGTSSTVAPLRSAQVLDLVGGIVAHNEQDTIEGAIRSLLDQEIGPQASWSAVWVVTSGCSDATVARVETLARGDPRVRLVDQPERRGKADAINTILERARGDLLVLLNGDACAEPGAIRALLRSSAELRPPFAVMARPLPPHALRGDLLGQVVELLWTIHDELHRETLQDGGGNHLSDELLLVSLPAVGRLSSHTINDGAYLGALLQLRGGSRGLAAGARVRIRVPSSLRGLLAQRRRIYSGHALVARETGVVPTTLASVLLSDPAKGWGIISRGRARSQASGGVLWALIGVEALSITLALWDAIPPRRDHVHWQRVEHPKPWERDSGPGSLQT